MAYAVRCLVHAGSVLGRAPLERLDAGHEVCVDQGLEVGFEAGVHRWGRGRWRRRWRLRACQRLTDERACERGRADADLGGARGQGVELLRGESDGQDLRAVGSTRGVGHQAPPSLYDRVMHCQWSTLSWLS